ncbi:MAG: glycosyltransferase [Gammaproteobacteria bacterium]|nr:glycosyltransferase [Gammaproteobacteria bacterium]
MRDSPWVDGPGRTILDTASMVDPQRYHIVVGAFSGDRHGEHAYLSEATRRGLETYPIAERRAIDPDVLRQIVDWCRHNAIDIIHTHDFRSDLYGLIAARRLRIPAVSTCHGWIANDLKGRIYTVVDKFLLRFFDRTIVVSARMQAHLSTHGIPARKLAVIQNALIVEDYRPDRSDRSVQAELGIPAYHKVVGNIGRLSLEKCQDLFLRAAAEIIPEMPDVSFVIVGIGPEEDRLRRLVGELGIVDHVVFAGYRADMQRVYNSLDLVVQSSSTEGMPNVVLEALLMRVPVVATDVGGTAEIVTDGVSGRLITPNDSRALTAAMQEALTTTEQTTGWAAAGEKHVRDYFNHTTRLQRIMDVYDHVMEGQG